MQAGKLSTSYEQSPFKTKKNDKKNSTQRNFFLKDRNVKNKWKYAKERNYCVSISKKVKRESYSNLNEKNELDEKNVKSFYFDNIISLRHHSNWQCYHCFKQQ